MGSFDAVCGLSNMAIGCNQPVVAMVIRRNPWGSYEASPLFPYDVWQPASVLVRGHYDDYGNVAIDDDAETAWGLTQEKAKAWWERVWHEETTTQSGHKIPARWGMKQTRLDYTFETTGERASLREEDPDTFSLWMAHAGIWDHLIDHVTAEYYHRPEQKFMDATPRHIADVALASAKDFMTSENPTFDGTDLASLAEKMGEDLGRFKRSLRYMKNPWGSKGEGQGTPVTDFFEDAIWDAYDAGDTALYESLTQHWHNSVMLATLLYQVRRSVCPPGTIGPQHGHDQPFLALAAAITEQAAINKAQYGDEFEDEDEDAEAPE